MRRGQCTESERRGLCAAATALKSERRACAPRPLLKSERRGLYAAATALKVSAAACAPRPLLKSERRGLYAAATALKVSGAPVRRGHCPETSAAVCEFFFEKSPRASATTGELF